MPAPKLVQKFVSSAQVAAGVTLASATAAFGQMEEAQLPQEKPDTLKDKMTRVFNGSEVTSTGWALPVAKLGERTTLRTEVGYGDFTPGLFVNHKFAEGAGEIDAGFMNFSQNVFPLGDTLSFNSDGGLYSSGEQSGDQFGLRYKNTLQLGQGERLEYAGFAGVAANGFSPSVGVNANYHKDLSGNWHFLSGAGVSYLGEREAVTLNGIAAVQKTFSFNHFPDGKWTLGVQLKHEFGGADARSRALAFTEYQTKFVGEDGPAWLQKLSGLFTGYAGTESYGGKAGLLYTPGKMSGGKKDFGVSFGPSVGWDSKQGGPQINLELRAGF